MYLESILFYAFSTVAMRSGLMVIRAENPVPQYFFLLGTFFNVSGLLLLEVDLTMVFLVVYVGAIALLFLFSCNDVKH